MYEVDKDRVMEMLSSVKRDVERIEKEDIPDASHMKTSYKEYYFVSMAIFTIVNNCIELGEEMIDSLEKSVFAKKYREIPQILFENKILTEKQMKLFVSFIDYRNAIAHEYDQIYEEEIFWCVRNLDFVREFMSIAKKTLLS